jgi:hypothetical protein
MTVNSSGAQIQSQTGTLVSPALFAFTSSDVRNMTYRIVEDSAAGAGNGGSTGHLRGEITQAASAGHVVGIQLRQHRREQLDAAA